MGSINNDQYICLLLTSKPTREMGLGDILAEHNSSLDTISYDIFDTFQKIFDVRERLNISLNQGYFHLAKARYSMGVTSVSSLQYNLNEDSHAIHKVIVGIEDKDGDKFSLRLITNSNGSTDVLSSSENMIVSNTENCKEDQLCESFNKNLRLRKGYTAKSEIETSENGKSDNLPEKKLPTRNDPLLWFGVLVPQSLKRSQQHFVDSVRLSCELSGQQSRLLVLQECYRKALDKKKSLINNSALTN